MFLPFHTVHGDLKARILKGFAIPFSSGPHFVRSLHHDPSVLVTLHGMAHSFTELDELGKFNSDDHYINYCGQESLGGNGVALIVNKRVQNAVLGCTLKNDTMISIRF